MQKFNCLYNPITATPFRNDSKYIEILPCQSLKPYIKCFWGTKRPITNIKKDITTDELIIPDTCMDIIFDHCEFVNVHLNQCSLSRVHFISCRISGMELSQSLVQDTLFQLCKGHYCDFGGSTFKECAFDINDLTGSGFVQCDFKKTSFDKCILNSTEWFNTKLKELDFSSCEIENIAVSSDKLTGVVVNSSQALEFVKLLGLVVRD